MTESPRRNLCPLARVQKQIEIVDAHLAHETILVNPLPLIPLGLLRPHLLHVLQHHVAVTVKRLDPREELAVVPARDQNLGVGACCGLQEGQGTRGHFMFLHESDLIFTGPGSVG